MEKTLGEQLVRTDFNPSSATEVDLMKAKFARLIDDVDAITGGDAHMERHKALARTELETACMYAVKAMTGEST